MSGERISPRTCGFSRYATKEELAAAKNQKREGNFVGDLLGEIIWCNQLNDFCTYTGCPEHAEFDFGEKQA